jgi:hypothetical protein
MELQRAVRILQELVRSASPRSVSGDEARELVDLFAQAERAASSGMTLYTPVVVETGSYAKVGHGSAADWLGAVSGSSAGAAKGRLAAAERAAVTPQLTEALHEGDLSSDQLKLVTTTAVEAPGATTDLLEMVGQGASHQELRDAAARLRAGARCKETERSRRARVHANRHLRWHQDEGGGIRGEFLCDEVAWANIAPLREADAKERWRSAGSKAGDGFDAHRLDAFLDLLTSSKGTGHRARPRALVVIDAEALRRGTTEGEELCEIEGIGPVSVRAATELIGQGSLQFVIRHGLDIKTVTKSTRVVAQMLEAALVVRDRTCAVPDCGRRLGLERDHRVIDYGKDGPTELDNLVRLCPRHHDMKTNGGWRLNGGPGHWSWVPPSNPPSAGRIARNRKLAAAKGKAMAAAERSRS